MINALGIMGTINHQSLINSQFSSGSKRLLMVGLLLLLSGCGKVGDPLPPFIRIPEAVKDLAATQAGHDIVLTWTNPPRNIDGSTATDLAHVQIRANGRLFATVKVNGPGQGQSYAIPITASIAERAFSVLVDTTDEKISDVSNTVFISPVEVPGAVRGLRAFTDQRRIFVEWEKPREHPELADVYVVTRSDVPAESHVVEETRYEDVQFQPGQVLTYQVTPVRRISGRTIAGLGTEQYTLTADDKTPPKVPDGLDIFQTDTGAILTWNANAEIDFAGYRLFRSEHRDSDFKPVADHLLQTNKYFDPAYRPGLYYAVSAVDEYKNESAPSAPFRGP
jgi:hypothetical protein